jgi:hypothetical protein
MRQSPTPRGAFDPMWRAWIVAAILLGAPAIPVFAIFGREGLPAWTLILGMIYGQLASIAGLAYHFWASGEGRTVK